MVHCVQTTFKVPLYHQNSACSHPATLGKVNQRHRGTDRTEQIELCFTVKSVSKVLIPLIATHTYEAQITTEHWVDTRIKIDHNAGNPTKVHNIMVSKS